MKRLKVLLASVMMTALLAGCSGEAEKSAAKSSAAAASSAVSAAADSSAGESAAEESSADSAVNSKPAEVITMNDKLIALTFDDGPNTTTTAEVLDKLEKYGIRASFFLIGNNINDASAKVVRRAYDMGCEINNHSRSHPTMTELSAEEIRAEFDYVDEKVFEITGEHTKFFRPPYIAVNQDMQDNISVPFIAGVGANDWEEKIPAEKRAQMILKQAKDGTIVLLHDAAGNSKTVEALDTIIPELLAQGYKFVTVSELFEIKGITPENKIYSNVFQKDMYS